MCGDLEVLWLVKAGLELVFIIKNCTLGLVTGTASKNAASLTAYYMREISECGLQEIVGRPFI